MESLSPEEAAELEHTANRFKLMAEKPPNTVMAETKYGEWIEALVDSSDDEDNLRTLQFLISVYGAAVAQACQAERELFKDLDRFSSEQPEV